MLDISDRLYTLHSSYSVSVPFGTNSGTVSVPGMAADGTWLVVSSFNSAPGGFYPGVYLKVQAGGFAWTRGDLGTYTATVQVYRG